MKTMTEVAEELREIAADARSRREASAYVDQMIEANRAYNDERDNMYKAILDEMVEANRAYNDERDEMHRVYNEDRDAMHKAIVDQMAADQGPPAWLVAIMIAASGISSFLTGMYLKAVLS